MMKIMFVCHGNICRSPMAEFIFKDLVAKEGLSNEFEIASSATSTEELGNPVYPPAAAELARHGLKCAGKYSVQLFGSLIVNKTGFCHGFDTLVIFSHIGCVSVAFINNKIIVS